MQSIGYIVRQERRAEAGDEAVGALDVLLHTGDLPDRLAAHLHVHEPADERERRAPPQQHTFRPSRRQACGLRPGRYSGRGGDLRLE